MKPPKNQEEREQSVFLYQMNMLVFSFPSLRHICSENPKLQPFSQDRFAKACLDLKDEAAILSASFVKSVFDGVDREFDFIAAYRVWDSEHRAAFSRWCQRPFWGDKKGESDERHTE